MKKLFLLLGFLFWASPVLAQNTTCATRPTGDNSNACASTAFVHNSLGPSVTLPSIAANQIYGGTGVTGAAQLFSAPLGSLFGSSTSAVSSKLVTYWAGAEYGADLTGVADSTTAINNCLSAAANSGTGGRCMIESSGQIYLASSITLPAGSSLECQSFNTGWASDNTQGTIYNTMSQIRLATSAKIHGNNSTAIRGCLITPYGMSFPQNNSSAWVGTAVDLPSSTSHFNDFTLENVLIMGFDTCFTSVGTTLSRGHFRNVNLDCNAGLISGPNDDTSLYTSVHVWPWATVAQVNNGTVTALSGLPRSSYGFSFTGLQDGATIDGMSLSYGHTINFLADGANILLDSFWSDSPNGVNAPAYGVYATSNAKNFTVNTLYTAGQGYGTNPIQALLIDAPLSQYSNLNIDGSYNTNCISIGPTTPAHVQISNLNVTNCSIGNTLPPIAIGNNASYLSIGTYNITKGAVGGVRIADLNIPAGMLASQINMPHGYSDIGSNRINIGANPLGYDSWTPTITCGSGSITTLGTVKGIYDNLDGKSAWIYVTIPITNAGTCTGAVSFTTPWYSTVSSVPILGRSDGVGGNSLVCETQAASNNLSCFTYSNLTPAASGATLNISGVIPTQ